MGGVSVDSGGKGGKKATDAQINMVPMIDLLVSCIAFLLMTAVWVQSGQLQASQPRGPASDSQQQQETPQEQLKIQISPTGLRVGVSAADMRDIARNGQRFTELGNVLRTRVQANQQNREVWLQPDGAVNYDEIIRVMDVVYEVYGSAASNQVTIRFL
ncbi:MAG: biopolymer transporter ExbD [Myxococcales bacterium]|nr:biopolymer transporter ExbD [Myxococcales bacterium]